MNFELRIIYVSYTLVFSEGVELCAYCAFIVRLLCVYCP